MASTRKFGGLYVAVTTPFLNGEFDEPSYRRHLRFLLDNGVDGLVPCGTTGEAATLTDVEKRRVIGVAADVAAGDVPVIAGVGTNSTASTIRAAHDAIEHGADALLVVAPYYNKPPQQGLIDHFLQVAEATNVPNVLYNVPGRTSVSIDPATFGELAKHPRIAAMKEATGDMRIGSEMIALSEGRATVMSGDDFSALSLMAIGGSGVISVVGNVDPRRAAEMVHSMASGDLERARRLHYELLPLVQELFAVTNPIPVKQAVSNLGFGTPEVRSPLSRLTDQQSSSLARCMSDLGLAVQDTP